MQMLRVLLTGKPLDGYHVGLVLQQRGEIADFFVPSKLTLVSVPAARLHASIPVELRPRIVAKALERRVEQAREAGEAFNAKAVERAFCELGASERRIAGALATAPAPKTEARREADRAKRAKLADALEIKASVTRKDRATGKMIKRTSELYTVAEAIEARAAYRLTDEVEVAREARKADTANRAAVAGEKLNGRMLPRPGTGARRVVEALLAEGPGSTDADLCRLYGYEPGTFAFGRDLKRYAERYGLVAERKKDETGAWRMRLIFAATTPEQDSVDIAA